MKKIQKLLALCLCLVLLLALAGCGKSEYVKNTEALISAIGEVTADSEEAIAAAEAAYNALTDEDKAKVDNADVLPDARAALEVALEEKAAAELEALRQSLLGVWKGTTDQIDLMCQVIDASVGDPRISFRNYLDSFVIGFAIEFQEDGSYRMYGDPSGSGITVDQLKAAVVRYYEDFLLLNLCDALESQGYGAISTWDEVENALGMRKDPLIRSSLGMSLSEFVDELFGDTVLEEMYAAMEREGRFTVEPDKLHLSTSPEEEPKDGDFESFTLEGDTLTFVNFSGTSLLEDVVYPLVFHRAS